MPYGVRMFRAWLFGGFLGILYLVLVPSFYSDIPVAATKGSWGLYPIIFIGIALGFTSQSKTQAHDRIFLSDPMKGSGFWRHALYWPVAATPGVVVTVLFFGGLWFQFWHWYEKYTWTEYGTQYKAVTFQLIRVIMYSLLNVLPWMILIVLPPMIVYWLEVLKENPSLRQLFLSGRGGSARWGGPATFNKYEARKNNKGIFLGKTMFWEDFGTRQVRIEDDGHLLTIARTGAGKSLTAIWPTLLSYKGSALVVDPKGEHAKLTLGYRQQNATVKEVCWDGTPTKGITQSKPESRIAKGRAFVLDPFNVVDCYQSARYNLLSEIDIKSPHARTMISAVSSSCVNISDGENKFWEETARQVLDGAIAHVLSTKPESQHNLPAVADMLLGIDRELGVADDDLLRQALVDMRMNGAAGGLPQRAAMLFDNLGEKAYGNVTAELLNALKFCTDPAMRECLTHSDFKLSDLYNFGPTTIYISVPLKALTEQDRWLRCLTELAMTLGFIHAEDSFKPDPPVLLVLDELPRYGKQLPGIEAGLVTLREAGVKVWSFVQTYAQLIECFGKEGAASFESSGTVQVFGVQDVQTAEWLSRKLGQHGITRKSWRRWKWVFFRWPFRRDEEALADPAAIQQDLKKLGRQQYVFASQGFPMRL